MKTKTEHTPIPKDDLNHIALQRSGDTIWLGRSDYEGFMPIAECKSLLWQETLNEVVRACNSHDTLVELLKEVRFIGACPADLAIKIDHALAKAEGKGE